MKVLYGYSVGDIVDDLQVLEVIPPVKGSGKSTKYLMKCLVCGRSKEMFGATLARHSGTKHSACGKGIKLKDKRFHSLWCAMRTRTTNENQPHWDCYGKRGISSNAFEFFVDFYDQMYASYKEACALYGERNVSLERIDVDGDYCKENCKWIHVDKQKANLRNSVYFEVTFPDGHSELHRNARGFAIKHNLNHSCFMDLLNGRLKSYQGYTGYRIKRESVTTKLEESN